MSKKTLDENKQTNSPLNKVEGGLEILAGLALLTSPFSIVIVGGLGCIYLTGKKYLDEPKDSKRGFFERLTGAAGMAFGTMVGMSTILGGVVVSLVGVKEASIGNAASFDVVQGAVWGVTASVAVPAVALVMMGEGAYKVVTGKPCNVISLTYDKLKSGLNIMSNFCGITQKPTQENIKTAGEVFTKEAREAIGQEVIDSVKKSISTNLVEANLSRNNIKF